MPILGISRSSRHQIWRTLPSLAAGGPLRQIWTPADGKLSPKRRQESFLEAIQAWGPACVYAVSSRSKVIRLTKASHSATLSSEIRNPDGSIVFRQDDIEVPAELEPGRRATCWRRNISAKPACPSPPEGRGREKASRNFSGASEADGEERTGEHSAKQVFDRMAGTWTYWGWKGGYFDSETDARAFYRRALPHAGDAEGARPTRRNGSTPACIGPMASMARARATIMSTTRPVG